MRPVYRSRNPHKRLIDLHRTRQQLAIGAHHRPTQLVQPRPRRLIRPQAQHVVQILRRGPVLLRGHQPDRGKPRAQRRARAVKDRPSRHRGLTPTADALPVLGAGLPRPIAATHRAPETLWPPQTRQIRRTRHIVGETTPETPDRSADNPPRPPDPHLQYPR